MANQYPAAVDAARTAARLVLALQGDRSVPRIRKPDGSPVSGADLAAQAVVGLGLEERFVGEEGPEALEDPALMTWVLAAVRRVRPGTTEAEVKAGLSLGTADPTDGFWTLDPIDGTKGFLRGDHFCLALARIEGEHPVFAALACPRLGATSLDGAGVLLVAEAGAGTLQGPLDRPELQPIARPPVRDGAPIRLARSVERSHRAVHPSDDALFERAGLTAGPPVPLDGQVKYAAVARGDADVFWWRPREATDRAAIWDHAAGALVAQEAGCVVTDLDGAGLDFSAGASLDRNRGILAAPPELHARLSAAISAT